MLRDIFFASIILAYVEPKHFFSLLGGKNAPVQPLNGAFIGDWRSPPSSEKEALPSFTPSDSTALFGLIIYALPRIRGKEE